MSVNATLRPPHLSSNSSLPSVSLMCFNYRAPFITFSAFSAATILLLLPLCLFVLYLGLRRWQKQRSSSSSSAAASHSDVFTYHMVAKEMIGILGCILYCFGIGFNVAWMMQAGGILLSSISYGQIFFHVVTCVERYLAVVHPITYLGLKNQGAVRIRNITIGCVWLCFLATFGLTGLDSDLVLVPAFCLSGTSMLAVSFCSISVLCALVRPGPGDGVQGRDNKTKTRAFYTIMAIMVALLFRFGGHLIILAIYVSSSLTENVRCGLLVSGIWFCLPSSVVLPLLFLHRAGKLCRKKETETGEGSE